MRRFVPTRRKKLMLVVLGPLVFFGLLEIGLRLGGYRHATHPPLIGDPYIDEETGRRLFEPAPDLLWTLKPSATLNEPFFGFIQARTNAAGFRGEDFPGARTPGEFRVLCLGDSATFGLGLAHRDTWTVRLEQGLQASPRLAGRRVRVINGGVPSWSSVQGMWLLEKLRDLEPDVVTFWFGMNDAKAAWFVPDREHSAPSGGALRAVHALRSLRSFQLMQDLVSGSREPAEGLTRVSREEYRDAVHSLLEGAKSGGPRPIFIRYPERLTQIIDEFESISAQAGKIGAEIVFGPNMLMHAFAPGPPGGDLIGRRCETDLGRGIEFGQGPDRQWKRIAVLRSELARMRTHRRNLDLLLAELPDDSLGYEDLFGKTSAHELFHDVCHPNEEGARRIGEALVREILRVLR